MNIINLDIRQEKDIGLDISKQRNITLGINPSGGTSNYELLLNKPSIEGHTLIGDSKLPEIGVNTITEQDIDNIIYGQE